jgi:hypothetical protein
MIASIGLTYWDVDPQESFANISSWCLDQRGANRLIVAVRPYLAVDDRVFIDPLIHSSASRIFGDAIIRRTSARAWPGTVLTEHAGEVYVIAFDAAVQRRMIDASNILRGWTQASQPPLPEDICLYREGDKWPVLVSVTHAGDAWLLHQEPHAPFVHKPKIMLPTDLIPPPPDFIVQAFM